ncbi:Rad1-domain-containing protein, partial [Clavulina sp. PMI_390]
VFSAKVLDVRPLAVILRGVAINSRATMTLTKDGIHLLVYESRSCTGKAIILPSLFDEWEFNPNLEPEHPKPTFEIPLNTMIEALNIFGSGSGNPPAVSDKARAKGWKSTRDDAGSDDEGDGMEAPKPPVRLWGKFGEKRTMLKMTYGGWGDPIRLLLGEDADGPTTVVDLNVLVPEEAPDIQCDADDSYLFLIMKSSLLREAVSEIDSHCDRVTLFATSPASSLPAIPGVPSPSTHGGGMRPKPVFRIRGVGTFGTADLDYHNDREVLETFECNSQEPIDYTFKYLQRVVKAMQTSIKTSIRIDQAGVLGVQFLLP